MGTADLAHKFAESFGGAEFARSLGLLHDVGKCSCVFAAYLAACASDGDDRAKTRFHSRDHKTAGAVTASKADPRWGTLAALTIIGHHGGMPDLQEARARLDEAGRDPTMAETLRRAAEYLGPGVMGSPISVPSWLNDRPVGKEAQEAHLRDVEMFVRMAFSALVDADWLDTERHFQPPAAARRGGDVSLDLLDRRCQQYRTQLLKRVSDSPVNQARREIYESLMETVERPPGLYQLSAPTGSGKTLLGLEWGVRHAARNGLRRLVTAVPFITVTDQVAEVYRSVLEEHSTGRSTPVVLEHHSQVAEGGWWQRLAAENWDAPVVVTTTVRLFESLFSNRPSDCRRLHRLARSVIVLDEVQALPLEMLEPIVDALRVLVERFGATVVLMTATQPTLERVRSSGGVAAEPLLASRAEWDATFSRTDRQLLPTALTTLQLASELDHLGQFLCVLNSIGDAEDVTRELVSRGAEHLFHLSTRLRPADRRERFRRIRARLAAGEPCQVVSTQLVEAGVDLDFPVVYRTMAPLPSLVQADGRCNRDGLGSSKGRTVVFDLDGGKAPSGAYYRIGTLHTRVLLDENTFDPWAEDGVREWYRRLLDDGLVPTDAHGVQALRTHLRYRSVSEAFTMIDEDTRSVVIPWPSGDERAAAVDEVLARLARGEPVDHRRYRALQDATVSLRPRMLERAVAEGLAESVTPVLYKWTGAYDELLGLQVAPLGPQDLIW
jgi:CRISPR-associated endonuclease/helicase Cas3